MEKNWLDWVAIVLVIIGAINWGFYGFSQSFDLVSAIFGGYNIMSRIIYILVGVAGLYMIYYFSKDK